MMSFGQEQSDGAKAEHIPPVDELRGSNSTLRLAELLENSLKHSGDKRAFRDSDHPTILQYAVSELNRWVEPIDNEVKIATSLKPPHNKVELEQIVTNLIGSNAIPSSFDLWQILSYYDKNILAVQDQWHLVQALFGIDTNLLVPGDTGGQSLRGVFEFSRVHEVMFGLIERAVQSRGGSFKMVTDERGINDTPRLSFKAQCLIDGIEPEVTVRNLSINRKNSDGYPNIIGVSLGLSPSFLASARPIWGEDYLKYFQRQGRQDSAGQQGSREQGRGESKTGSRQEQEQEGFRRRSEGSDPRDPQGYYKTLGINPDTDPDDIAEVLLATYRRLAHKYHSDTGGENANDEKMKAINIAFEFLNKVDKRRGYGR